MSFLLYLTQKGLFREEDTPLLAAQIEKTPGGLDQLLAKGGLSSDQILKLKSEYYGMETRDLTGYRVPTEVLKYIPEDSAQHYQIAPIGVADQVLEVGMVDPDMAQSRDAVQFIASKLQMPYKLYLITQSDFKEMSPRRFRSWGSKKKERARWKPCPLREMRRNRMRMWRRVVARPRSLRTRP